MWIQVVEYYILFIIEIRSQSHGNSSLSLSLSLSLVLIDHSNFIPRLQELLEFDIRRGGVKFTFLPIGNGIPSWHRHDAQWRRFHQTLPSMRKRHFPASTIRSGASVVCRLDS